MSKNIPKTNQRDYEEAEQKIQKLLADGQWWRAKDLEERTQLSPATLSKHLKRDLKIGSVERQVSRKLKEYPRPVSYRRSQEFHKKLDPNQPPNLEADLKEKMNQDPANYVHFLLRGPAWLINAHLMDYFAGKESEAQFKQQLESILWVQRNSVEDAVHFLIECRDKGKNIIAILEDVERRVIGRNGKIVKDISGSTRRR